MCKTVGIRVNHGEYLDWNSYRSYMAPEVFEGKPYNHKSDIWSLGVLLYQLCTLDLPFKHPNVFMLGEVVMEGRFPPIPEGVLDDRIIHAVNSMLIVEPLARPSTLGLLRLPIVQSYASRLNLGSFFPTKAKVGILQFPSARPSVPPSIPPSADLALAPSTSLSAVVAAPTTAFVWSPTHKSDQITLLDSGKTARVGGVLDYKNHVVLLEGSKLRGVVTVTVQITVTNGFNNFVLGVIPTPLNCFKDGFGLPSYDSKGGPGWGFHSNDGKEAGIYSFGKKVADSSLKYKFAGKASDTLTMCVDVGRGDLDFFLNRVHCASLRGVAEIRQGVFVAIQMGFFTGCTLTAVTYE